MYYNFATYYLLNIPDPKSLRPKLFWTWDVFFNFEIFAYAYGNILGMRPKFKD
jgi:hypothetical protein